MLYISDRVPLFVFLSDVQKAVRGTRPAQHIARVYGAEMGKAHQLARITVDVRARVDHENGLARAGKQRADGWTLDAGMESEQQGACGHHGAGVAGRNERVALALFLKTKTHGDRRSRLASDRRERLVPHADDFGRLDDLNPAAVDRGNPPQRRLHVRRPPPELLLEVGRN